MPGQLASSSCGSFIARRSCVGKAVAVFLICILALLASPGTSFSQTSCCVTSGNINGSSDDVVDILDLTYLVAYMFKSGPPPPCPDAANVNGVPAQTDILDLTYLVAWMFKSGPAPVPCPSGGLTPASRGVVFAAIDSVDNANLGLPADSFAVVMVAYLLTRPEIEAAEVIDTTSISARFSDGRLISIPNNREPTQGSNVSDDEQTTVPEISDSAPFVQPTRRYSDLIWGPETAAAFATTTKKSPQTTQFELPTTVQARVVTTLGSCFTVAHTKLVNLLSGNGYVMASNNGSVQGLLNVSGDGVFIMEAHCGAVRARSGAALPSIWTATAWSEVLDSTYELMLNANELAYMKAWDQVPGTGQCVSHWRFAYTPLFVAQYMTFAKHSLVIIGACESDRLDLKTGFSMAGASVYCAWTKTVKDDPANLAAEFLVDRLLGANESTLTPKESPPQRAFNVIPLWQDMITRVYDTDFSNGSRFIVTRLKDGFDLLAPTIRFMQILETGDSLQINGIFGTDPGPHGRVIIGGTELPIISWTPQVITCFIPNTGAGSVGPVHVEVDGLTGPGSNVKRMSNEVNITEWRGPMTYVQNDAGTLTGTIDFTLHLRADIHTFRESPHTAPISNQIIPFGGAHDSFGAASATGQFVWPVPGSSPPDTYTYTWTGSAYLPGLWESPPTGTFVLQGQVNIGTKVMQLLISGGLFQGLNETLVSATDGEVYTIPLSMYTATDVFDTFPYYMNLTLNDGWDIVAGSRSATSCCSHDPANTDINHHMSWPLIQSSFPPDSTAAQ